MELGFVILFWILGIPPVLFLAARINHRLLDPEDEILIGIFWPIVFPIYLYTKVIYYWFMKIDHYRTKV